MMALTVNNFCANFKIMKISFDTVDFFPPYSTNKSIKNNQ